MRNPLVALCLVMILGSYAHAAGPDDTLISTLIWVESRGDDMALGDKQLRQKAYGCLQIRQPVCDDINRRYGTSYKAEDCLGNRDLSKKLCRLYLGMYATEQRLGRSPTYEDMARVWNGGPSGCFENGAIDRFGTKTKKEAAVRRLQERTKTYWLKVNRVLEQG